MLFSQEDRRSLPVLIIEDQPIIAFGVESVLLEMGFEKIVITCSAAAAVLASQSQYPKLIVSDIHLGDHEDNAVVALKSIDGDAQVPTVFVTSSHLTEELQSLVTASNSALVRKPFTDDRLREAIYGVLVRTEAQSHQAEDLAPTSS